ncbi:MAG: tetratricopeptide repeat protein [Gammaproteobacteria bacterium]|nr:tetratricopeptide repeat protein [Gammaproteobacteria bacterium]
MLLLTALLGGCSQPVQEDAAAPRYVPNESYHLMMAEIAIQRGMYLTAAQEYLTAAERSKDSATARRATEFAFDYGYDRFALRSATRWIKLEPDSTVAHEYLGRLHLRRYDLNRAVEHFAAALGPRELRSGDDYLALEADLSEERNARDVLRLLLRLHGGDERTDGFKLAVARAAYRTNRYLLALAYARQVAVGGNSYEAEILTGRILFASGATDAALVHIENLARTQPVLGLELEYVRLLAASRREGPALQMLGQMFARYGRDAELLSMRAMISMGLGDIEAAEQDLNELAASGRSVYQSFYYLGQIEASRGDYEKAIRHFKRIGAGEYLLPAQSRVAEAHVASGDPDLGLEHLAEFGRNYPRYGYEMIERRALLLQSLRRDDEALAELDELLRIRPGTPALLISRGIVLDRLERRREAIETMKEATAIAPYDASALNSLGYTLALENRRLDDAFEMVRFAVHRVPDSPPILDSMGWLEFLRGDAVAARSWLELAYRLMPDPEIAAHLGEVLYTAGETGPARRVWQEALIQNPDSKPLLETIARFPR